MVNASYTQLKVGDKVQINTDICGGLGLMLYRDYGVNEGQTYTVVGLEPDEDPLYNARYGGYIKLDGIDEGHYVMEDFKVVGGDSQ